MALPEEVHEFLKMTHTSSAFLKPPISLIAHHICSQLTSIVLIYLQGKQEKIIFEHLVYVFREQLRDAGKQIVKMKASSICSFLTEGTGGMRRVQEPELTPFFTWASGLSEPPTITEGTGVMDTFLVSSQMQEYLCYTHEPLKWVAQSHHPHITSVLVSISQNIHRRPSLI